MKAFGGNELWRVGMVAAVPLAADGTMPAARSQTHLDHVRVAMVATEAHLQRLRALLTRR